MEKITRQKTRIHLDADGIFRIDMATKGSLEDAKGLVRDSEKIINEIGPTGKGGLVIIDMRDVSLPSILPYRDVYKESAKAGAPRKSAILGDSRLFWVLSSFVYSASGMVGVEQKVKFFTSEKEAIAWLKE